MFSRHWLLGFVLLSMLTATAPIPTGAATTQITDRAALGGDDVIDWAGLGPAGTTVSNPFSIASSGGLAADVSKPAPQGSFQVYYQTTGAWQGNFAVGDAVLWSQGDPGPIALDFANPVAGAGAQIQQDTYGTFTGVVRAYDDGGGLLAEYSLDGGVLADTGDDSAIFLGVLSDSTDIARIELSLEDGASFGINQVDVVSSTGGSSEVTIDVAPGDDHNLIVPAPRLPLLVAILGSRSVDVHDVDVTTLAFGPDGAEPVLDLTHPFIYRLALRDVNDDGATDLLALFLYGETGIPLGESEACLTGEIAGTPFEGCDTVFVLPGCGLGVELVLVLAPLMWLRGRRTRS